MLEPVEIQPELFSPERIAAIQQGINKEFVTFSQEQILGFRNKLEIGIAQGDILPSNVDEDVQKRQQYYDSLDFPRKISELTNNFRFWWPDGWYREFKDRTSERIQMMTDLDEIIKKCHYEPFIDLVLHPDKPGLSSEDKQLRRLIVADVYLQLRDKGYERTLLTS